MPRLPRSLRTVAFAALAVAVASAAAAQSASAVVSASRVVVGQTVTYTLTLGGGRGESVGPPLASGALRLRSQFPVSDATTSFNGRTERTLTWAYEAVRPGTGRIGRFRARVAGQPVVVDGISVTVERGPPTRAAPPPSARPGSGVRGDLFARAEPSRRTAYVGEQVVVGYELYFEPEIQPRQTAPVGTWDAPGAWREEMDVASTYPRPVTVGGQPYDAVTIRRIALFPTRAGTLDLAPMQFTVDLLRVDRQPSADPFAPFFSPFTSRYEDRDVTAASVSIDVRPLPAGAPPSFSGAVGQFEVSTTVDQREIDVGEAVRVQVSIRGDGNTATLTAPEIAAPAGFDAYDPREEREVFRGAEPLRGVKTFTYTLVPQGGGRFEIPAAPWTYFDPAEGRYVTVQTEPVEVVVQGDALADAPGGGWPRRARRTAHRRRLAPSTGPGPVAVGAVGRRARAPGRRRRPACRRPRRPPADDGRHTRAPPTPRPRRPSPTPGPCPDAGRPGGLCRDRGCRPRVSLRPARRAPRPALVRSARRRARPCRRGRRGARLRRRRAGGVRARAVRARPGPRRGDRRGPSAVCSYRSRRSPSPSASAAAGSSGRGMTALVLALALLQAVPAQTERAEAERLFNLGNQLVAEGDTAGAVAAWQGAWATGWTSAAAEHNLGTVALAQGDVARARLHLERAARLDPLDGAVRQNLRLARERAGEPTPSAARGAWNTLVAVVRPLGLVALALALAFGALALALAARQRAAAGLGLVAALAVAGAALAVWERTQPLGVALADQAVVEAPSPTAGGVARLRAGETVEVGDAADGWRHVTVGRADGWVRADAVEPI